MRYFETLETARTILRPFRESDLPDMHGYCSQPGVGEAAGWKHHTSLEETRGLLRLAMETPGFYAVEYRPEGKAIGHFTLHHEPADGRENSVELGFVLNRDYHRRGLMKEIVREALGDLFARGAEAVYAGCFGENGPSRGLIEACGFAFFREYGYESPWLNRRIPVSEYVFRKTDWELLAGRGAEPIPPG